MNEKKANGGFFNAVLNGMAQAIVVALIANAVLGEPLKLLEPSFPAVATFRHTIFNVQFLTSALIGIIVGLKLGFDAIKASSVGMAAFIASGSVKIVNGTLCLAGIGDLINVMLIVILACLLVIVIANRLGSLTIILLPIIVAGGMGTVGVLTLPYVSKISSTIGEAINYFTTLQPILMCILIALSFSIIIISPMSTVAIGLAIGLQGLASGAANLGVSACTAVLIVGSWRVNKAGVTLAVALGGMKLMIPNLIRHPIIALPVTLTAAISGIGGRFIGIMGDKVSAGFGLVGLVGPIKAFDMLEGSAPVKITALFVAYALIPFGSALLFHFLFTKIIKLYKTDVFQTQSA